jgi:hypothetical protein
MESTASRGAEACGRAAGSASCQEKEHRMSYKEHRAITQTIDARVEMKENGRQLRGTVTGHYDDDTVFVKFDDEDAISRVYTVSLRLVP